MILRMPGGKPNLNGLWQAMTTAYWDLEDHSAQPGPVLQLGAIGAIPAGGGIVEGGAIPYKPEALAKRKENFANRLKLDPEVKCYLPGVPRATYMAVPVPDCPVTERRSNRVHLRFGRAHHTSSQASRCGVGYLDGHFKWQVGR